VKNSILCIQVEQLANLNFILLMQMQNRENKREVLSGDYFGEGGLVWTTTERDI
jgi:hypothetical protein